MQVVSCLNILDLLLEDLDLLESVALVVLSVGTRLLQLLLQGCCAGLAVQPGLTLCLQLFLCSTSQDTIRQHSTEM